jgi:hypothetical protein
VGLLVELDGAFPCGVGSKGTGHAASAIGTFWLSQLAAGFAKVATDTRDTGGSSGGVPLLVLSPDLVGDDGELMH